VQTTSLQFTEQADANIAVPSWRVSASFDKVYDPSVEIFTLDVSLLDGPDILALDDSDVVTEWDKYLYTDYSDRVLFVETTRQVVEPSSMVQTMADVTFKNDDDFFTPNSGSPIDQYILPKRPFRIFMGFKGEVVPLFVGLSEKMPTINKTQGTATFHLIDFLSLILDREVPQTAMLLNYSTGEILSELFGEVGILPDQMSIDTSFNRIPFFFVEKGIKLRTVVEKLMIAEQGRLYLDELGIITFKNRQNYSTTPVWSFDKTKTIDYDVSGEDDIINSVKIKMNILSVMSEQSVWESAEVYTVPAGGTKQVWVNLTDPITSVVTPIYATQSEFYSHFLASSDTAGEFPYADISVDSIYSFGKSVLITFENTGATTGYVTAVDLWGTPVKTIDEIIVQDFDQTSIDAFDEQKFEFETEYIQDEDQGISMAAVMVNDYKDLASIVSIDVQGNPALQLDDMITLDLDGFQGDHIITKITNIMRVEGGIENPSMNYEQRITAKFKEPIQYFILSSDSVDMSLLDSDAVLMP